MGEMTMMSATVSLLGFLVLMALVIAMGTQSTRRYEQEKRAEGMTGRSSGAEAMSPASA
jgi:uncharacterized membrane protein